MVDVKIARVTVFFKKMNNYIDGLKIGNLSSERSPTLTDYPNQIFILDRHEVKNGVNPVFLIYKHCIFRGMVSGYGLRGAGYGMRGTGYGLRGAGYGMRGTGFGLRVAGCGLRGTGCGLRVQGSAQSLARKTASQFDIRYSAVRCSN